MEAVKAQFNIIKSSDADFDCNYCGLKSKKGIQIIIPSAMMSMVIKLGDAPTLVLIQMNVCEGCLKHFLEKLKD